LKVNLDEEVLLTSWDTLVTTVANIMGNEFKLSDVIASLLNKKTRKTTTQLETGPSEALTRGRSISKDNYSHKKSTSHSKGR
jgi:hypothetical protein